MSYMVSFADFLNAFPSEDACYQYLIKMRWPDGFVCPHCGHKAAYFIANRKQYQCVACRKQTSVTAGTVFHKLRLPLKTLFWAVFLIGSSKKGVSAMELQRKLEIRSYKTAWSLYHKIRKAMASSGNFPLACEVEIDKTKVRGRRPGAREHGNDGESLVAAAIETNGRYMGRTYLTKIADTSPGTLAGFVSAHVAPGATVRTRANKSYELISDHYYHVPVARKVVGRNDKTLPKVTIVIGNLKKWLFGIYNCMPTKHLQRYLDEFVFRFNRRQNLGGVFDKLLNRCLVIPTITYAELTG